MPDFNRYAISLADTKGRPLQAQFEHVILQKLPAGGTSQHTMTGTIYRDSEGRGRHEFRVEVEPGMVVNAAQIHDPTSNTFYVLDLESKTVTHLRFPSGSKAQEGGFMIFSDSPQVPSSQDLGQQQIEGFTCRGTRLTAGDSVVEFWRSDELKEVLLEKRVSKDEESTWRLFNIRRTEPDNSLFAVPADYRDARDVKEGDIKLPPSALMAANASSKSGREALLEAASVGDVVAAKELLAKGIDANVKNEEGYTPLILAAWSGHTETAKVLLAGGADVEARDKAGMTALIQAAADGYTDTVQALLAGGANVNAKDVGGRTALMFAAMFGHTETAKTLIAAGANVNTKAGTGYTPLMLAVEEGRRDIVEVLLTHGADVNAKNDEGYTPLKVAAHFGHTDIIELLKKAGAKE